MRVTCNKASVPGSQGGVNVYYTGQPLSGDYAVRFSMNLMEGDLLAQATEGALFGINHSGAESNWWNGSGTINGGPWASDGVWYYVTAQATADAIGDFHEYIGAGGALPNTGWTRVSAKVEATFANNFKHPPYTAQDGTSGYPNSPGTPANLASLVGDATTWSDVEIKQVHNVVTMSINKTPIFVYTNTTTFTSGVPDAGI